ncbi:hypothetical protein LIER_21289 [Lithospermum erythrorhizon]|uniref:Uncharacterized protein n=1 Tax=Lithospermum erythrorhizon TaxID=34254 RepID=A0AAV3QSR2_LITER
MAGDEAGNGPPHPEDGPATSFDPGDALSDASNTLCTPCPPCYTAAIHAATGDDPLCRQTGGHGLADLGAVYSTFSPQQDSANPTSSQTPPSSKLTLLQPPASSPVGDCGLSLSQPTFQPQPIPSDQAHDSVLDNLISHNSSALPTTGLPHLSFVQDPPSRPPFTSASPPLIPTLHAVSSSLQQPVLLTMQKAQQQPVQQPSPACPAPACPAAYSTNHGPASSDHGPAARSTCHGPAARSGQCLAANSTGHGPTACSTSHGPAASSNHGLVAHSTGHGPPARSTGQCPAARSTGHGPADRSTGHGPAAHVTDLGPAARSTNHGPASSDHGPAARSTCHGPAARSGQCPAANSTGHGPTTCSTSHGPAASSDHGLAARSTSHGPATSSDHGLAARSTGHGPAFSSARRSALTPAHAKPRPSALSPAHHTSHSPAHPAVCSTSQ